MPTEPTEPTEPTPARPGAAAVAPALPQPHPRPRTRTNPGHSADSAATWFGASLLLFFLTLVVPVAVMGQNFGPLGRVSTLLALFVTWYAALRLAGHYRTGRPHLVQITFWAFVYLFMGLASFAQLTADTSQIVDCSEELPDYLLPDYEFEIPDLDADTLRR